jgi:hypothetical protein
MLGVRPNLSKSGISLSVGRRGRFAAALIFLNIGASFPACGQFIYPILVVPPPPQDYSASKPKPAPDKPKLADAPAQTSKGGHYEGRIWVPE